MAHFISHAALLPTPWKNGGGSTTEIAIWPAGAGFDTFDWRISLATIAQSGPFSTFRGIDRTLALVEGGGVTLDLDQVRSFTLGPETPEIAFPGEAAVTATVHGGPTTDFNVMTRRARCRHHFTRLPVHGVRQLPARPATTLLFLAHGQALAVRGAVQTLSLARFDAAILDAGTVWTLDGEHASVFMVDIYTE